MEEPAESKQDKALRYVRGFIQKGQTSAFITDLRTIDFKAEVLPFDSHSTALLKSDFAFWAVTLLAVTPVFLVTLADTQLQLFGFCIFFAAIWGVIFKKFIVEETGGWKSPLLALTFTSFVGINLMLLLYHAFPDWYMNLNESKDRFKSLLGFVGQVGLWEELFKILPALIYLAWKRKDAQPLTIVLLGVFSGLGFAAFENLGYTNLQVDRSLALIKDAGAEGLSEGVKGAMVNVMLRSISSVFGHAVYSGIFAYYIALAKTTKKRFVALFLMGWLVSALVHGLYDWAWEIQDTIPALITAFGFVLFYAYLTKLRLVMASRLEPSSTAEAVNAAPIVGAV